MDIAGMARTNTGGEVARAGQRLGPLDAPTAQAEQLALWLRQLTRHLTQRQLAEQVGGGRTRWGSYLKGRVLIPYPVLRNLVRALVPEQQQHDVLLKGRELLDAARTSLSAPAPAAQMPALTGPHVLAQQLHEAHQAHAKTQQTLVGTTHLVHGLLRMVSALEERCSELEEAAEVAAVQAEVRAYAWAEDQLAESERLLGLAIDALERARDEREQAEELRAAAAQLADRHRRALAGLDTAAAAWTQEEVLLPPDPATLLPVDAFHAALQQAEEALGVHAQELSEVRDSMGIPQSETPERIVRGHVVDNTAYPIIPPPEPTRFSAHNPFPSWDPPPPNPADRLQDGLIEPPYTTVHSTPTHESPDDAAPQEHRRQPRRSGTPLGYSAAVELSSDRLVRQRRRARKPRRHDLIRSHQRALLDTIRYPARERRNIVVVSGKGGVGKTTTLTALGSVLAVCRQDKVAAVDINPDTGTLGRRLRRETGATIRDLIQALPYLSSYMDVRRFTSQNPQGLEVVANDVDPSTASLLEPAEYVSMVQALERWYSHVLTDTGTALTNEVTQAALARADQLVVVAAPNVDGASTASITVEILMQAGYEHLVRNAVLVINASHGAGEGIDVHAINKHFAAMCRTCVTVPFDEHLAHGAEIDLDLMRAKTRQAYVELAAAVTDGLISRP